MPAYNTPAIVLRRLNFGETDKILTLFSPERGRFSAIAKGARKAISRLSGATEVLTYTRFQLATGRSLEIVTQCEVQESFPILRQDLAKLAHGLYFADLIDHSVADNVPSPTLFQHLLIGLYLLQTQAHPGLVARWFEIQLLIELGYAPMLTHCSVCREPMPGRFDHEEEFALSAQLGGVLCPHHARPHSNDDHSALSYQALSLVQTLADWGVSPSNDLIEEMTVLHSKPLDQVRLALRRSLRLRLERDLKSLEFLDSLSRT